MFTTRTEARLRNLAAEAIVEHGLRSAQRRSIAEWMAESSLSPEEARRLRELLLHAKLQRHRLVFS